MPAEAGVEFHITSKVGPRPVRTTPKEESRAQIIGDWISIEGPRYPPESSSSPGPKY